jgi:DNA primase large subunit
VAASGYTLADLLEDPAHSRSRARAANRVGQALQDGFVQDVSVATPEDAEVELLAYPVARALVAQVDDSYLVNRFAVAESKLVRFRLKDEASATVRAVGQEVGLSFEDATLPNTFVRLPFVHYLKAAPTRETEWKLVNQTLDHGYVALTRLRAIRLVEEAVRIRLGEELGALGKPGRPVERAFETDLEVVRRLLAEHHARYRREQIQDVRLEAFPPCMTQIWEGIKAHQNVPHTGRFAIVAFLHKLGMNSEKILEFFSAVPDFDPDKSRYQIEHITGETGGATEYTPPGCQTMATYGICPLEDRDDLCFKINHPLSYYRRAYRQLPTRPANEPAVKTEAAVDG